MGTRYEITDSFLYFSYQHRLNSYMIQMGCKFDGHSYVVLSHVPAEYWWRFCSIRPIREGIFQEMEHVLRDKIEHMENQIVQEEITTPDFWSREARYDLRSFINLDSERTLQEFLASEMYRDISRNMMREKFSKTDWRQDGF